MDIWRQKYNHSAVLYAQNCPQEPLIFPNQLSQQQSQLQFRKHSPNHVKKMTSNMIYRPHIIIASKRQQQTAKTFREVQHQRELQILCTRIRNCKSLTQRKKDHNDPILYPAYFIRQDKRSKDARIDTYFRKLIQGGGKKLNNLSKAGKKIYRNEYLQQRHMQSEDNRTGQSFWEKKPGPQNLTRSNFPLPSVTQQQDSRKKRNEGILNLPSDDTRSIISFVMQRKLFLKEDLRILKARLIHNYGKNVEPAWQEALYAILHARPHQ